MRYLPAAAAILVCGYGAIANDAVTWRFDRLDRVGGHETAIEGSPTVVETALGKAVEFDGATDAMFVDVHPLAGAETFTWEAIFRPDGGQPAQRWFHLQESGSENRMLFELRIVNGKWFFDSYVESGKARKALIDRDKVHPLLAWYHVAAVYDGREFRNYVNGIEQSAAQIHFDPQKAGRASIGVRINKMHHFKGALHSARFSRTALAPAEFMKVAGSWKEVSFPTHDGGVIHADLYGTGARAVVLVHGGRFDKATWSEQAYALSKSGFRVLAIDLRGVGRSRGPGQSDVFTAPLHHDVLAAVRYLRHTGARSVSLVGASLGGSAAANAALESNSGDVERLVLLAATPSRSLAAFKGRTLFITARDDVDGSGTRRLDGIRRRYEQASEPKELIVLDGDAHAQFLFATDQRERVMQEMLRFLR